VGVFNDAFSISRLYSVEYLVNKWRTGKDLEGSGCGYMEALSRNFPREIEATLGKYYTG
jgi:hypothetical protein